MSFSIKLEMGKLQAIEARIQPTAQRIIESTARQIQSGYMHRAPVDTGAMRASCTVTETGPLQRSIGPTVDYALFVELGTRHKAARPALRPAFDAVAAQFKAAMRGLVD